MSFVHWLVLVSACVSLAGSFAYIRNTLKGQTKPNRVSWLLWAVAPLIGTGAALSAHADVWATTRIFLAGFIPLMVLLASFVNRQSYWKLSWFDFLCGACSVLALVIWGVADSPRLAVLLAATADGFAALPTILKAWQHPETETGLTYAAGLVAVLLVLPSIPKWSIENSAFQVYLLIINAFLILAVYRRRLGIR
ncbi:MAG: hypothetical protein M1333_03420 [Patescibacteria group bacterium]|nr:hypothetical protein [Patescibacteria group bacterium]